MAITTPTRAAVGCLNLISILGGLGAGVTLGYRHANGIAMASDFENALKYGPSLISGVLGYISAKEIMADSDAIEELATMGLEKIPSEAREGMYKARKGCIGCSPVSAPVMSAGLTALATWAGYYLGRNLSQ